MHERIAVIGAGPAGLSAAYSLSKAGREVDVYEASAAVGGLARSFQLWGQTVDLGPHRFFSADKRVNQLWLEVVGPDYVMVDRLTRILYGGCFYDYPLRPTNVFANLGPGRAVGCIASYAKQKLLPSEDAGDFESWVTNRFGRRLYEIFFKSYSEKLWGISCRELDADFAAQRIKRFSLGEAIKSAFSKCERPKHKTLVDQFAYPIEGTGMVYARMAASIHDRGGRVLLNEPVRRVVTECGRVKGVELCSGDVRDYDNVVSSMPLTLLIKQLPEAPRKIKDLAQHLHFRNTVLVYLEVESNAVCADNWIYVHNSDIRTGRITNFRNWAPQICGRSPHTILAMEYWCNDGDELWLDQDDVLIAGATKDLLASTLIDDPHLVRDGYVYRIARCYPVYRRGYRELLEPIQDYLSTVVGLQAIGRYGSFKYNNQDHSILMGLLAADNVLECVGHDLWTVNCDYDAYQEDTYITETGLVSAS
jgi:protoporphyrinogen oxidase